MKQSGWCLVLAAGLLAGCGDSPKTGTTGAAMLNYIPADSPYVFALTEPMPDDLMDKMEALYDEIGPTYRTMLGDLAHDAQDDGAALAMAMLDEFSRDVSFDGMRERGIDMRSLTLALYGYGVLPVLRFSLADPARFEAALARVENAANKKFATGTVAGQTYRVAGAGQGPEVLFAAVNNDMVVVVVPPGASEALRAGALGITPPANGLGQSGRLAKVAEERDYTKHFGGYIDVRDIVERLIGEPRGSDKEAFEALGFEPADLDAVCKSEIRELAGVAPELIVGYTRLDGEHIDAEMLLRVRPDIAGDMTSIAAPVPGLGLDMSGMMGFGVGLNIPKARRFVEGRIAALEADPFECELFADMQNGLMEMKAGLDQPMMPFISGIKGFRLVLESIDMAGAMQGGVPDARGRAVLAMDAPQSILGMVQMFAPQLASLDIEPDGKPVRLETGAMPGVEAPVYLAMNDDALAFSYGEGEQERLADMLSADTPKDPPVLAMSYDLGQYMSLMDEVLKSLPGEPEDEVTARAFADLSKSMSRMFSQMGMALVFEPGGVRMDQRMELN